MAGSTLNNIINVFFLSRLPLSSAVLRVPSFLPSFSQRHGQKQTHCAFARAQVLQLLGGVAGILIYVAMTAFKMRFFPVLALTEAGVQEVKFRPGIYHTLQIIQVSAYIHVYMYAYTHLYI
jgi:hypothetical protein